MTKQFPLFFYVLARYTDIMIGKGYNLFNELDARYVHLFPHKEECTSSSREYVKMYTSGSTANSQSMLTEIKESDAIAKMRI